MPELHGKPHSSRSHPCQLTQRHEPQDTRHHTTSHHVATLPSQTCNLFKTRPTADIIHELKSNSDVKAISDSIVSFYGPLVRKELNENHIQDGQAPYQDDVEFRETLALITVPWCTAAKPNKGPCRAWPCIALRAGAGGSKIISIIAGAFQKHEETTAIAQAEAEIVTNLANAASMGE